MNNLTAAILLLASLGLFFGYLNPAYRGATGSTALSERSVAELREEQALYNDALQKTREIELARTGLLEKYNGIAAEDHEKILKFLPDHLDSVRLILDINTIAAQFGLTLRNITLSDVEEKAASGGTLGPSETLYATVELKFSLRGSYDNFRSFLRESERSLRLTDVQTLAFAGKEESAYDYEMTVSTYRLK